MDLEWKQVIATVVPIFIMFLWLLREQRADFRSLNNKIDNKIDGVKEDIAGVKSDINKLDKRLTRIEARIEFSGKTVYIQQEKPEGEVKEN